jgi:putative phage-type endonuclease
VSAVLLGTWPAGSDEWHAARAHGLGGSEIGAAAGLSPFESRFSLWHRKAGAVGALEQTPEMEWGSRLEPAILGKFADEHPEVELVRPAGTWRHEDRPWQIANPDGLIGDDEVVEAKFSLFGDGWGEAGTADVPIHVRTQVMWYLDVLGRDRARIAVLVGGFDYREYVVEYSAVEAAELRAIGEDFLNDVALGRRPDIDEHSATYQVIKELHPEIDGTEVVLSNATARQYMAAKARERLAKDAAREATARVADEMGTAQRATWDGMTIATRQARDGGLPYVVAARGLTDAPEVQAA